MWCPQIWNIEKEKEGENEIVGQQASEAQRVKELEQERKKQSTGGPDVVCVTE